MWTISIFATCLNTSPARYDVLAVPAEEKLSVPGFCRASAMKSETVLAGNSSGTTRAAGTDVVCVTPAKSLTGSKGADRVITFATGWPLEVSISVYPSAAALATLAVPATPGRFSTITCCFQMSASLSAMIRAWPSVLLPAENGTTIRTS
jgi:hypothetical protein